LIFGSFDQAKERTKENQLILFLPMLFLHE